ncbi:hypothetical protein EV690_0211 [Celerinatantimonas diazotrophica]|uniref:Uncharacterized protein n=1 Tax=Celerinatantimonas diazotrophica TaxID=412034 RepID=A0A4R1KF66_9GAMM|nr:hypothetical protein EV690_0211 [Celerinatantimonas diazotrophica]CAG9298469.1 hypothetical protein CEDIAZO_03674 [Celerinatantimonas diazotrophica]
MDNLKSLKALFIHSVMFFFLYFIAINVIELILNHKTQPYSLNSSFLGSLIFFLLETYKTRRIKN